LFNYPGGMAVAKALTEHRRTRVVELVTSGLSYEQAAVEVGYRSRSAAWKAFHRALADREADAIDEHRALEVERLDAVQAAYWAEAVSGDVQAAAVVLRCIEARAKVLGLDQPSSASTKPRSIIAAGHEEAYRQALAATQSRQREAGSDVEKAV
jgi:hypothetical protein